MRTYRKYRNICCKENQRKKKEECVENKNETRNFFKDQKNIGNKEEISRWSIYDHF